MAVVAYAHRGQLPSSVIDVLESYTAAALTAAATKYEWLVPYNARIFDVNVNSGAVGAGGTSTIIDVNINGTTIYTTQANRPTLLLADSGRYAEAGEPEITTVRAGDIISFDVDQITTTGPTRTIVTIVLGQPA